MATAVVAGGSVATTMLVGLVTNAVSETSHWPAWLGWMQEHAWLSFVMLGVVLAGFTALLAMLPTSGRATATRNHSCGPMTVPGRRGALVLRSLPRDTAASTDRAAELDLLRRSVAASQENGQSLPVHVIDGMPGVGKTTFAVHAGHVLSERFPNGQLFVNLNGHTPGRNPVQATEALASLLAATGVPTQQTPVGDDIGAVTEARAVMWRSRLADRKALLILDNAASYRQLEPLLPGGNGCLVLVTSRRRLAAYEEVVMAVEALPPEHAIALFTQLSGRPAESFDRAVLEELVRLCGCLPLGVSLLAARLRHHPAWSAEDLRGRLLVARDRLREIRAGERAVAATFDLSYRDLPEERQRFFRRLGCTRVPTAFVRDVDVSWLLDQGVGHELAVVEVWPAFTGPRCRGTVADGDKAHGEVVVELTHVPGPGVAALASSSISESCSSVRGLGVSIRLPARRAQPVARVKTGSGADEGHEVGRVHSKASGAAASCP
ncbi:NB-ARC domain-containing protein [Streptomyces sp. NPDC004610]|uniref:NB-ARC domain-containing protein n=1 Tax=unclassified Streptomyces TaxID=2593676 RepID=UPI0033B15FE9